MTNCATCGRGIDEHDRDIRFRLPDAIASTPQQEHGEGIRMSDLDPDRADMIESVHWGSFIRALLQVRLTGGYSVTYGVWVNVDSADLDRAVAVWDQPEYADLRIAGRLANAIEPWKVSGASVGLRVLDENEVPYVIESSDRTLQEVLSSEWEHDPILRVLPSL